MSNKTSRKTTIKQPSKVQTQSRKLELLEMILFESSSSALNTGTNYLSAKQALINHTKLLNLIEKLKEIDSKTTIRFPERNDRTWSNFFEWVDDNLKASNEEPITDRIAVTVKENVVYSEEYALVAKKFIDKSETIFNVPQKMMLTTQAISNDPQLAHFIKNDSIASSMPNVTLVLYLLNEYSKAERSYWWPYLSILPSKILPVLDMNMEKLQTLTISAHLFEFLKMIRAIARQYSYFYKCLQATSLPLNKHFTFQYYIWGVSIVCSRQNEIHQSLKENSNVPLVLALIPIFDMCNHNHLSTKPVFQTNKTSHQACNVIQPGEEITIDYGTRSSGEFYIHNGFVPNIVPNDFIPLTVGLNGDGSLYASKAKLLGLMGRPIIGTFKLKYFDDSNWNSIDSDLMLFLLIQCLNEKEMSLIIHSEDPARELDDIFNSLTTDSTSKSVDEDISKQPLFTRDKMYLRIREYLAKRASLSILLIDRFISNKANFFDHDALRLLEHEKSIHQSYLLKTTLTS